MKERPKILTNIEKSRNRFSAEYFSRGAAQSLKNSFKDQGDSVRNSLIKQIEKSDKEKQKIKQEKEEKIKKKKKLNAFDKARIIGKIAIFGGLAISAIALFEKLNNSFPKKSIRQLRIDYGFNTDDENRILNDVKAYSENLSNNIDTNYLKPLTDGVDFLFNSDGFRGIKRDSTREGDLMLSNEPNITESQKKYGIIGQVFYNVGLAAIWRAFTRRGYGFVLHLYGLDTPEWGSIDLRMWNEFAKNTKQYMHVARSLANDALLSDKILKDNIQHLENMYTSVLDYERNRVSGLATTITQLFGGMNASGGEYSTNFEDIQANIENLLQNRHTLNMRITRQVNLVDLKMWKGGGSAGGIGGPYFEFEGRDVSNKTVGIEEDESFQIISRIVPGRKIYYNEEYQSIPDTVNYIESTLLKLKRNGHHLSDELINTWKRIISFNFKNWGWDDSPNRFLWTYDRLADMGQLVAVLANLELYQAIKSVESTRGLYQSFFNNQMAEQTIQVAKSVYLDRKQQAEQFMIEYAKGQLSLDEFINKMSEQLNNLIKRPMKILEDDIKIFTIDFMKSIPYGKIQSMVSEVYKMIQEKSIVGNFDRNNLLILDNESFRENFKVDSNYDRNNFLDGRQFDKENLGKEPIYGDDERAVRIFKKSKKRMFQGIFKTTFGVESFHSWYEIEDENRTVNKLPGYDWGYTAFGYSRSDDFPPLPEWCGFNPKTLTRPYTITYEGSGGAAMSPTGSWTRASSTSVTYYKHYFKPLIGYRYKNRYETLGNDGKVYLVDAWDYVFLGSETTIFSEEISRVESQKSHLSTYNGEYDERSIRELYNLPPAVLIQRLQDVSSNSEEELKRLIEEREQLLNEISEKFGENEWVINKI